MKTADMEQMSLLTPTLGDVFVTGGYPSSTDKQTMETSADAFGAAIADHYAPFSLPDAPEFKTFTSTGVLIKYVINLSDFIDLPTNEGMAPWNLKLPLLGIWIGVNNPRDEKQAQTQVRMGYVSQKTRRVYSPAGADLLDLTNMTAPQIAASGVVPSTPPEFTMNPDGDGRAECFAGFYDALAAKSGLQLALASVDNSQFTIDPLERVRTSVCVYITAVAGATITFRVATPLQRSSLILGALVMRHGAREARQVLGVGDNQAFTPLRVRTTDVDIVDAVQQIVERDQLNERTFSQVMLGLLGVGDDGDDEDDDDFLEGSGGGIDDGEDD